MPGRRQASQKQQRRRVHITSSDSFATASRTHNNISHVPPGGPGATRSDSSLARATPSVPDPRGSELRLAVSLPIIIGEHVVEDHDERVVEGVVSWLCYDPWVRPRDAIRHRAVG